MKIIELDKSVRSFVELFLIPVGAPRLVYQKPWYVLSCMCDGVYKRTLAANRSSPCCGCSGFPLSLSEWSFTIYPMLYNRINNVFSASLNKTFPSFLRARRTRLNGIHLAKCSLEVLRSNAINKHDLTAGFLSQPAPRDQRQKCKICTF